MLFSIVIGLFLLIVIGLLYRAYSVYVSIKKENDALKLKNKEFEKVSKETHQFISDISSEFRTPLYAILGLTSLIVENNPQLKNNQNLKSLKFSGNYLLTLINNVLQINEIDTDVMVQNKLFNLEDITQNLIHSFEYATESTDNTFHFDYDHTINPNVKGDPVILSQILMNLINNALKFTKNGNIYFSVNQINQSNSHNTILFSVKHDGYEISKEDQQSIYEEFTKLDRSKGAYINTGLNSKIIKKLTNAIDSDLKIEKDINKGSNYSFTVTYAIDKNQGNILEKESSDNLKILIVDDNKLNLFVTSKILIHENYDCSTIDNGFDAIEMVKENHYDLILMDINMPNLNGIGTTKKIREFNTEIPIVALTAVDVTQLNRQIIRAGLNDYILKPLDKNLLLDIMDKYLTNQKIVQD